MTLVIFQCPKCKTKAQGSKGSTYWCFCKRGGVRMQPEATTQPKEA